VFHGANPVTWARHVRDAAATSSGRFFVNAWNEWAEGACLEHSGSQRSQFAGVIPDVLALGSSTRVTSGGS
jgi:hypothetical protein